MNHPSEPTSSGPDPDPEEERREIAAVDDELDAEAGGDGLAAEAGRGEETGLSEG
jgi:hypothetical protein